MRKSILIFGMSLVLVGCGEGVTNTTGKTGNFEYKDPNAGNLTYKDPNAGNLTYKTVATVYLGMGAPSSTEKRLLGKTKAGGECANGVGLYDENGTLVGGVDLQKNIIDIDGFGWGLCNHTTAIYDDFGYLVGGECIGSRNDTLWVDENGSIVPEKIFTLPCAE